MRRSDGRGPAAAEAARLGGGVGARQLCERLAYVFADPTLLERALTHPSCAMEQDGSRGNERLEFLGDAVLDLTVARLLFEEHPDWDEGHLTRARAALVNGRSLASRARELGLDACVRLGRTEQSGGRQKQRILANVFEAVVGAVYLDGGIEPAMGLTRRCFADALASGAAVLEPDAKTRFQEWAHATRRATPRYAPVDDTGEENGPDRFGVEARLEGEVWGRGRGRTKRAAEQAAASDALARAEAEPIAEGEEGE